MTPLRPIPTQTLIVLTNRCDSYSHFAASATLTINVQIDCLYCAKVCQGLRGLEQHEKYCTVLKKQLNK